MMKALLEESKQQLLNPLGDARRKLLIILNVVYIILVPTYLISEKIATGNFVNDSILYLIYGTAVLCNLISAIYNIRIIKRPKTGLAFQNRENLDLFFGFASVIPILAMSFFNMVGLGNPSNDAILTDFAMAQSLMIVTVIIIGRKAVIVWFIIVITVLFWNVSSRGWDYEYHYSTPSEVAAYKEALQKNESWALQRKAALENEGLNPPKITRYFNTWIVFIIVAFLVAYFFSGITIDILKIVPSVVNNIEKALEGSKRMELEQKANEEKTNTFINLAHETKTPLTLINNYLDAYIKKYGENKEIQIIKWNVQRLTTDIINFFDLERFNRGFTYSHDEVSNLSSILSYKLPLFENVAEKKSITVEKEIDDNCFVLAHPGAIERIVNNLMENALKFTPESGVVKISLSHKRDRLHFCIADNGIGIPTALHSKIFEPYFQLSADRNNQGMGMGLAIVKKIVDDLNGEIVLNSDLNRGTQITVILTAHEPDSTELISDHELTKDLNIHFSPAVVSDVVNDPSLPFILIVEDNITMLSYLIENISSKYNVYATRNGNEALEKLASITKVDLIISDVMMEGMDGMELCKAISENRKHEHVPFIFLTAKSSELEMIRAFKTGAVDYIEKPFLIDQVLHKIDSILNNLRKQRIAVITRAYQSLLEEPISGRTFIAHQNDLFEKNCQKYNLTAREIEIVILIARGHPHKIISDNLNISTRTVDKHVSNIFEKVGVSNKVELINKLEAPTL
jgi:signal transduction histidine kinase/DNA-binding NarL/FixJ family response regulator